MKLLDVFKKTNSSMEPIKLSREKWAIPDKKEVIFLSNKKFYTHLPSNGDWEYYNLDLDDLLADDWSYAAEVWKK